MERHVPVKTGNPIATVMGTLGQPSKSELVSQIRARLHKSSEVAGLHAGSGASCSDQFGSWIERTRSSTTWSSRPRNRGDAERPFRRSIKRLRKSGTQRGFTRRDPRGHSNPGWRARVECETLAFAGDDGCNKLRPASTPGVSEVARNLYRKPAGFHQWCRRTTSGIRQSEQRPGWMMSS